MGAISIYFKHLLCDIGQWLDLVALVVSVAGATADDPIAFLWSLVIIYVVTIVAETIIGSICAADCAADCAAGRADSTVKTGAASTDNTDDEIAIQAHRDTRKLYRTVNYLAVFIAVAGLIFCQIVKDSVDEESEGDVNGTSTNWCNITSIYGKQNSSSINGVSDDDDEKFCDDDWIKNDNYNRAAQYVCAVLAVSEGGSDMIGLILAIPEMIYLFNAGAKAKAALHLIIVLIGSLVLTRESEGYIDADGARYIVQSMFIPIVICLHMVIAVLVTWPRNDDEKGKCCGPFKLAFFNRYSKDDGGFCSCGSV